MTRNYDIDGQIKLTAAICLIPSFISVDLGPAPRLFLPRTDNHEAINFFADNISS